MAKQTALQLGWCTRVVTPTRPAMLQGQMHVRVARQAMDPLTVTALAIDNGDPQASTVLVSMDTAMTPDVMRQRIRDGVQARLGDDAGLMPEHVLISATHTHASLVVEDIYYVHPGGDVMLPGEAMDWLVNHTIDAVCEAWRARTPRLLTRAFGHAVVGHNRHVEYADGHAQMYGKTNREDFTWIAGYEDHSLDMLFVYEPNGALSGVVLSIPCPAQVSEHIDQFSADFWHDIRSDLRKRFGHSVYVLGMCGPAGDQSPHLVLYREQEQQMRERTGLSVRQEIARRVGEAVQYAFEHVKPEADKPWRLAHEVKLLALTPRGISQAERDEAARMVAQSTGKLPANSWFLTMNQAVVDRFDGKRAGVTVPAEVHAIRLDDMVLATNPFEMFLDYGLQIKARSKAGQTMLAQLTGAGFYLPSPRAVRGGGYGAMPAVAPVGPEGGHQLVEATLGMIDQLFTDPT